MLNTPEERRAGMQVSAVDSGPDVARRDLAQPQLAVFGGCIMSMTGMAGCLVLTVADSLPLLPLLKFLC